MMRFQFSARRKNSNLLAAAAVGRFSTAFLTTARNVCTVVKQHTWTKKSCVQEALAL